jgi:hypothetical protein
MNVSGVSVVLPFWEFYEEHLRFPVFSNFSAKA